MKHIKYLFEGLWMMLLIGFMLGTMAFIAAVPFLIGSALLGICFSVDKMISISLVLVAGYMVGRSSNKKEEART